MERVTRNLTILRCARIGACIVIALCTWLVSATSYASWSQSFSENQVWGTKTARIVKIELFDLYDAGSMQSPGMSQFSKGSWTDKMPNSNYSIATDSTAVSNFNWLVTFTGGTSTSISLAALSYTNKGTVYGTYMNYTSSTGWTFTTIQNLNINDPRFNRTPASVPIPPAALLFGPGLLGLVRLRKRFKN
ncbi:MAG TPA: hypothetical protein VMT62_05055 [Syntrophorhabdaceae bacterium]|nr:hypothetical protein [Syntrophorhabdaceae bacterium]